MGGSVPQSDEPARKRADEELDRYFAGSLDLLCVADTDGYFRRLNPEWERTLGYTLRDLEGHRFLDVTTQVASRGGMPPEVTG
jgi:PAS domain S-box-containing protein